MRARPTARSSTSRRRREIAEQTNAVEDRNAGHPQLGGAAAAGRPPSGGRPVLEKYVGWVPKDVEVKRALASSYRATGQNDKAKAIEKEVGAAPPAAGPAAAAAPPPDQMNAAMALYNEKKYAEAAAAFEKVLVTEPNNRDALYGLANAYVGLKSPEAGRRCRRGWSRSSP